MGGLPQTEKAVNSGVNPGVLYGLLRDSLKEWTGLEARYFAEQEEGGVDFPLEATLRFTEPLPGLLVIRAGAGFVPLVKRAVEARASGSSEGRDLFLETVVRFYQKFIWHACDRDCITLKPASIRSSRPADWPDREPDASCLVLVELCPVEIRYWAGDARP